MILVRIALRNLFLHKFKTIIVGSILFLGTVLVIVGGGLLDAIDKGMERSLVNSVSAHIQLYNKNAKDEFKLFGNFDGSMPDVGHIENFKKVKEVVQSIDNVATVVPMGIDFGVTTVSNILERKLAALREAHRKGDPKRMEVIKNHVRRIIKLLDRDLQNAAKIADVKRYRKENGDPSVALARTRKDAFWDDFAAKPLETLEFLENEIGPLAMSEDIIWVRYIGTDTELFQRTFDRFEIVEGTMIPPGKRGFLFNKRIYEEMIKNKTARRLDKIKERLGEGKTIASCDDCQKWIRNNQNQVASLVYQFDETASLSVQQILQEALQSKETDLAALMKSFMTMTDENFKVRYELFYKEIAANIMLYTVAIGDEFVLTAFSRGGGYMRKVPMKVYGTFRFRSLDRSPLAGGFNIMDIITFRDLYGYMTAEKRKEQAAIRKAVGVKDVKPEDAEAMFEDAGDLVQAKESETFDPAKDVDLKSGGREFTAEIHKRTYSKDELWQGVVINAAVMLKDGSKLKETMAVINKTLEKNKLAVTSMDWHTASGTIGQFIGVIRIVLYGAVFVIFIVAMIIINNSLLMSTMERTREIGTMRAIGAGRGFVRRIFLFETGVLALIFGGLGALVGAILMLVLKSLGIPASSDFFYFIFAGPRLHPELLFQHVIAAVVVITLVGFASTYYPARLATKISPREAMGNEE